MTMIHLTDASVGAPALSGQDGALAAVLDWAVVQNSWAIEATSGNYRVYRPGSGNRFRLCIRDEAAGSGAAQLCVMRGAENFVSATSWTDPFPTVAVVADASANILKSSTANATARAYHIWLTETQITMAVNFSGSTNIWEWWSFGDAAPTLAGDSYNTYATCRNSTSTSAAAMFAIPTTTFIGSNHLFWCRSFDGTVKSTNGGFTSSNQNGTMGNSAGCAAAQGGTTGKVDREKYFACCCGSTTTSPSSTVGFYKRGWIPFIWSGMHNGRGTLNTTDTFQDTAYSSSAVFRAVCLNNVSSSGFFIMQEAGPWSAPT